MLHAIQLSWEQVSSSLQSQRMLNITCAEVRANEPQVQMRLKGLEEVTSEVYY